MHIRILGAAAGGGFPQWNCNCPNCGGVRREELNARPRTQSSIAIRGADETAWTLVNASPDILAQLHANPQLQPGRAYRDTGIRNIVLTDSQIDHTTGLYMLREATKPWPLWCTDSAFDDLTTANPILQVLRRYCGVDRRRIDVAGEWFAVEGSEDLRWQAIALPGKPPPYSARTPQPGDVIGLLVEDLRTERRLCYAPGVAHIDSGLFELMCSSQCVLVDGTFWTDDELVRLGVSHKRAADMGHLSQTGGMIKWLDRLPATTRRVLIHINNTNPILVEDSPERALLSSHSIEVAYDGMEIVL
ncbi:pyrroloquinoline quinone biosynthesis protein PqqB [Steroidobacter agaridevorans]|uniref:pyrroloquinoline quinone biosynthesis protein PqqB n=1 Tax=Steroidobacter agaridevorans TaxID=2695856 RepID=UPI00132189ED|nr:pyrroloquinoline quinone biosynthesis protein PqqB [Steroidobacter agaridevorans]GFE85653.1 coenzyme PQQ synthesis protein B [Steroidobacter agaridevorans]